MYLSIFVHGRRNLSSDNIVTWKVWNQRAYCDHGYSISCSDTTISETTINHHVNIPPWSVPPLDTKRAWRVKFPFPLLWLGFFVKAFYIWSIFSSIAHVRVIRPTKRLLDVLVVLITQEDTKSLVRAGLSFTANGDRKWQRVYSIQCNFIYGMVFLYE